MLLKDYVVSGNKQHLGDQWSKLLCKVDLPNFTAIVSFVMSLPTSNASVERIFLLMGGTEERNRSSVDLIKSEIQVKVNFNLSCLEFYKYVVKEADILDAA